MSEQVESGELDVRSSVRRRRRRRYIPFKILGSFLLILILALGVTASILYYNLSRGFVSNDRIVSGLESQLSSFLGSDYSARIGDIEVMLDEGLALRARDVELSRSSDSSSLGTADSVYATLGLGALLLNRVSVEEIRVSRASISLPTFFASDDSDSSSSLSASSPTLMSSLLSVRSYDFGDLFFSRLGFLFFGLDSSLEESGIERVILTDIGIDDLDSFGFFSGAGRLDLTVEKSTLFERGIFFDGTIQTGFSSLRLRGSWKPVLSGGYVLDAHLSNLSLREFLSRDGEIFSDSLVDISVRIPYTSSGVPLPSDFVVTADRGRLRIGAHYDSHLESGRLSFRYLPSENRFEILDSPFVFPLVRTNFSGNMVYPSSPDSPPASFLFLVSDIESRALVPDGRLARADVRLSGGVDYESNGLRVDDLRVTTPDGSLTGTLELGFDSSSPSPSLALDVMLDRMEVDILKQLWPPFVSPRTRLWFRDGIIGGVIRDARLTADLPPGVVGHSDVHHNITPDQLILTASLEGGSVKTLGDVPRIAGASGSIDYRGLSGLITLDGRVNLGGVSSVSVTDSSLHLTDTGPGTLDANLELNLSGDALSFAHLGIYSPLDYTHDIGLAPDGLSGDITSHFLVSFTVNRGDDLTNLEWQGKVEMANFSSDSPIAGTMVGSADLSILVNPSQAVVEGTATLNDFPARLSLVESIGTSSATDADTATASDTNTATDSEFLDLSLNRRSISVTLDEADRARLGIDASPYLSGPVLVTLTTTGDNPVQRIEADLLTSTIDLPWLYWRKESGVPGRLSFDMVRTDDSILLDSFELDGEDYGAEGSVRIDESGLLSAEMKNVHLNKGDDFDFALERIKGGFDISVDGRSYDGRGLISTSYQGELGERGADNLNIRARIGTLYGHSGNYLRRVSLSYRRRDGKIDEVVADAITEAGSPTVFTIRPFDDRVSVKLLSEDAGTLLRFLDIYASLEGGNLDVDLLGTPDGTYAGTLSASDFYLLNEPRLAALMASSANIDSEEGASIEQLDPDNVQVKWVRSRVLMRSDYLEVGGGRLHAGNAGAGFEGVVYDEQNRINIRGTYLPAYDLNNLVSRLPFIGRALGTGSRYGLLGITFKMSGPYNNPNLTVNPVSIIAPGVLRKLFEL